MSRKKSRQRAQIDSAALKRAARKRAVVRAASPPDDNHVVVGWFAYHGQGALCDGDACVIAGSQQAIRQRTRRVGSVAWQHRSTTFGEIVQGIKQGGAYAFDDGAYAIFVPLATRHGLSLPPASPVEPPPGVNPADHLVHVRVW